MRKFLMSVLGVMLCITVVTQAPSEDKKKDILSRAGDHFMFQFSYDHLMGTPDSIDRHIKGLSRGANFYLMLNKPFKGDPRFSVAGGVGVGTSNIYFKKMTVDIAAGLPELPFTSTDSTGSYKKYKLTTAFLEVPLEFRFSSNPYTPSKSVKVALGVKLGTMVNAHTKSKTLRDLAGKTLVNAVEKINTKSYFNTTRFAATARIGYGNFSLFGAYGLTGLFKDGVAANMKLLQVGLTISGL